MVAHEGTCTIQSISTPIISVELRNSSGDQSQSRLYSRVSDGDIPAQAYTDLIKASWILIDIISKHPQEKFLSPTAEYLQVRLLAEV